jgi:hypothetical protein
MVMSKEKARRMTDTQFLASSSGFYGEIVLKSTENYTQKGQSLI